MVLDCPPDLLASFLYDDSMFCLDVPTHDDMSIPEEDVDELSPLSRRMYCLVRVDEDDSSIMRMANDADVSELAGIVCGSPDLLDAAFDASVPPIHEEYESWLAPKPAAVVPKPEKTEKRTPSPTGRLGTGTQKPGGPCDHCGATESPQWRRGPASKPQLCNACGTRYRRTNQLGTSSNSAASKGSWNRKRGAGSTSMAAGNPRIHVGIKKQRCVESMMGAGAAGRAVRSQ